MKRLSEKDILSLIFKMEEASSKGWKVWDQFYDSHIEDVEISFPGGELFNENISGFVWAWSLQKKISYGKLTKADRFSAQGLEYKVIVNVSFLTALLVYKELPRFRRQIKI